jgi:hypothetical protein
VKSLSSIDRQQFQASPRLVRRITLPPKSCDDEPRRRRPVCPRLLSIRLLDDGRNAQAIEISYLSTQATCPIEADQTEASPLGLFLEAERQRRPGHALMGHDGFDGAATGGSKEICRLVAPHLASSATRDWSSVLSGTEIFYAGVDGRLGVNRPFPARSDRLRRVQRVLHPTHCKAYYGSF